MSAAAASFSVLLFHLPPLSHITACLNNRLLVNCCTGRRLRAPRSHPKQIVFGLLGQTPRPLVAARYQLPCLPIFVCFYMPRCVSVCVHVRMLPKRPEIPHNERIRHTRSTHSKTCSAFISSCRCLALSARSR